MPAASLDHPAPYPARGTFAAGYGRLASRFAEQLRDGSEIGAALTVHRRGACVVDVWGGLADVEALAPWREDTRIVVFSATKGLASMGLHLLADRGRLDWDAPVASYWPAFAQAGKAGVTVRTLFNHRAGLLALDEPLRLDDCMRPERADHLRHALESQRPAWTPGSAQGYHALTFGLYASVLFEIVAGEPLGPFLRRELLEPLGSDAWLGTPASEDERVARLYPPEPAERVRGIAKAVLRREWTEPRILRALLRRRSLLRRAFLNPRGEGGVTEYNRVPARRAELAWASATASARGLARAYLPFASVGTVEGRVYLKPATIAPVHARQSWSERDLVLQKPIGWSEGFVKEQNALFSPNPESFGHPGMGGALGWCDPVEGVAFGYVMNRMDWRVRSPRAIALCRALYACEAMRG